MVDSEDHGLFCHFPYRDPVKHKLLVEYRVVGGLGRRLGAGLQDLVLAREDVERDEKMDVLFLRGLHEVVEIAGKFEEDCEDARLDVVDGRESQCRLVGVFY